MSTSHQTTDDQLIQATRQGDREAFGTLVQRYQDRLYGSMVYFTQCTQESEDVVQEAFVQAFTKLDKFQGRSAFYTWLYRIAVNTAISRRRRKKPTQSLEQRRALAGNEPVDSSDSPEKMMERRENVNEIQAALGELPEDYRQILVTRELEGMDYESIAELFSIPMGTVRSRLHRARIQLRDVLVKRRAMN